MNVKQCKASANPQTKPADFTVSPCIESIAVFLVLFAEFLFESLHTTNELLIGSVHFEFIPSYYI